MVPCWHRHRSLISLDARKAARTALVPTSAAARLDSSSTSTTTSASIPTSVRLAATRAATLGKLGA